MIITSNYVQVMGNPTRIISGFPGVGKTHFYEQNKNNPDLIIRDSDSTAFRWDDCLSPDRKHNPDFPYNYIRYMLSQIGLVDIILVSSHAEVREPLSNLGLLHYLVYPERDLKKEYMERYFMRGSDEVFLDMMESRWNEMIDSMESQANCNHVRLQPGEYIADRLS